LVVALDDPRSIRKTITLQAKEGQAPAVATYLDRAEIILKDIWALPDRTMHSLADAENSSPPTSTTAH